MVLSLINRCWGCVSPFAIVVFGFVFVPSRHTPADKGENVGADKRRKYFHGRYLHSLIGYSRFAFSVSQSGRNISRTFCNC